MSHGPERVVADAIRAAVGGPDHVARIICEDLKAAGHLGPPAQSVPLVQWVRDVGWVHTASDDFPGCSE